MNFKRSRLTMMIGFLAPATILYVFIFINPAVQAFFYSFRKWDGFSDGQFIGLANFHELLFSSHFWGVVMKNTFLIVFVGGAAVFLIAFLLGGILTTPIHGKVFFKNLIFFPSLLNPVAVALLWSYIYHPELGILNGTLKLFGLTNFPLWTAPENLFWAILAALVWMHAGYYFVMVLSALERIPGEIVESAKLDGASELTVFFHIKIPLIIDVIRVMVVFWCITGLREFALFYAWGGGIGAPSASVQNIAVYLQFVAFGKRVALYRMGYGTAIGVVSFIISVLLILAVNRVFRSRRVEY